MDSIVNSALDEAEEAAEEEQSDETKLDDVTEQTPSQDNARDETESSSAFLDDDELDDIVKNLSTSITVVGCGGGGSNTIMRMMEETITGCELVAMNTDAQHLSEIDADQKLLIGRRKTGGRGAGSRPKIGQESALENREEILEVVSDEDMVFVTAGMGGGTGTGAAPVVAEAAKESGALTISVVTLPFTSEGEVRRSNAEAGLEQLRKVSDTVIVIPNDRLLEAAGDVPLEKAFRVCDEVLMRSVKGITELITTSSIVNLDFADVQTIMENGGVAMIGLGESQTGSSSGAVVDSAVSSPLLDVDVSTADSVLVNVTGGPEMSIDQAEGVVENLHDRVDEDARIIWGTGVDQSLGDKVRALVLVTGVSSSQIYGQDEDLDSYYDQEGDEHEGIDHIV